MKKLFLLFLLFTSIIFPQTRSINPRTNGAGSIGVNSLHWLNSYIDTTHAIKAYIDSLIGEYVKSSLKINNTKFIYSDGASNQDPYIGYELGHLGSTFGKISANEMHVKSFIADIEQALVGGQVIAKSVAKLANNFELNSAMTINVEEIQGYIGHVFADGDYIRIRNTNMGDGFSLNVTEAWITVTYDSRDTTSGTKIQRYTYTKMSGVSTIYLKGSLAIDYGTSGDGILERIAISASGNKPYDRIATWTTAPYLSPAEGGLKTLYQSGDLSGLTPINFNSGNPFSTGTFGTYTNEFYAEGNAYFAGNIFVSSNATTNALLANSISIGNITGSATSAIKLSNTGTASTSGLFGYAPNGTTSFALRLNGIDSIAGWQFDDSSLTKLNTHLISGNTFQGLQVTKDFGGSIGTKNIIKIGDYTRNVATDIVIDKTSAGGSFSTTKDSHYDGSWVQDNSLKYHLTAGTIDAVEPAEYVIGTVTYTLTAPIVNSWYRVNIKLTSEEGSVASPLAEMYVNSTFVADVAGGVPYDYIVYASEWIYGNLNYIEAKIKLGGLGSDGDYYDRTQATFEILSIETKQAQTFLDINTEGIRMYVSGGVGNLEVSPSGILATGIRSSDYVSQTTGYKISDNGDADFRYLYTNELHAKTFIADMEQALAGSQIISKSVAKVKRNFTIPIAGYYQGLFVEPFSGYPTLAVFSVGDVIRLRQMTRSSDGVTVYDVWGTIYSQVSGVQSDSSQLYIFKRSTGADSGSATATGIISKGSLAIDYGVSGQGYYEVSAIDGTNGANSPYARVFTWTTHPATGSILKAQFGNLSNVGWKSNLGTPSGFGLYGQNVFLTGGIDASFGKIGGTKITTNSLYSGTGTWGNSNTPFFMDSLGRLSLGDKLKWDGSLLQVVGSVSIQSNYDYDSLLNKPTSLSQINSSESSKLAGIAAGATNVTNTNQLTNGAGFATTGYADALIPATIKAPSGDGLYLSSTYIGFYKSSVWKSYMDNDGNFILGDTTNGGAYLAWKRYSDAGYLSMKGNIVMNGGSISWSNVAAPSYTQITGTKPNTTYINSNGIYTASVNADSIKTGTLSTSRLNFVPVDTNNVVAKINASTESGGTLKISAAKLTLTGYVTFADTLNAANHINWGTTTISGGKITANSITTSHLNFTPITTSIANMSITSDKLISVSGGNTTFVSSGDTSFASGTTGTPSFSVTKAGVMTATSGYIGGAGGWIIDSKKLSSTDATNLILTNAATDSLTGNGTFLRGDGMFRVGSVSVPGGTLLKGIYWNGANLIFKSTNSSLDATGKFTSTLAEIGGFTIGANDFFAGSGNTRVQVSSDSGIWLGATNRADAPFSVTPAGVLTASNVVVSGVVPYGDTLFFGRYINNNTVTISGGKITAGTITSLGLVTAGSFKGDSIVLGSERNFVVTKAGGVTASNLAMTGGTITWANVTAPTYAQVTGTKPNTTYIDANGIYTASVNADSIKTGTLSVNRLGAKSITADKINIGSIIADSISTGYLNVTRINYKTITEEKINISTIHADSIITGHLSTNLLLAKSITADKINVGSIIADSIISGYLNVARINTRTITGDKLNFSTIVADSIKAGTFTGLTFQTASSGDRQVLNANGFISYDVTNNRKATIYQGMLTSSYNTTDYPYTNISPGYVAFQMNISSASQYITVDQHSGSGYFDRLYLSADYIHLGGIVDASTINVSGTVTGSNLAISNWNYAYSHISDYASQGYLTAVPAGYTGGSSIATLGTVTSGIWNAGAVTSSGNLTINGTGNSSIAGSLLVGTTSNYGVFTVRSADPHIRVLDNQTATQGHGGLIGLGGNTGLATAVWDWGRIGGYKEAPSGDYAGYLSFETATAGGSCTEKLRISSDGLATFVGNILISKANAYATLNGTSGESGIDLQTGGVSKWLVYKTSGNNFAIYNSGLSTQPIYIYAATGNTVIPKLVLGAGTTTAGAVKFESSHFYGYDGSNWLRLDN